MSNAVEIKEQLIKKLRTVSDDKEFLLSIINHARHVDDRKVLIEYLEKGEDVTYENLILLSLELYEKRYEK